MASPFIAAVTGRWLKSNFQPKGYSPFSFTHYLIVPRRMKMARKTPNNVTGRPSPADLMPPGLRGAVTRARETRVREQSQPPDSISERVRKGAGGRDRRTLEAG